MITSHGSYGTDDAIVDDESSRRHSSSNRSSSSIEGFLQIILT